MANELRGLASLGTLSKNVETERRDWYPAMPMANS